MLRGGGAAEGRMGIPVFPRRPARHGHHRSRLCPERARTGRKSIESVKIVTSGAGAAALACLNLSRFARCPARNIWITDRYGVAYRGRVEEMDRWKGRLRQGDGPSHARRRDPRRRRLSGIVGRRGPEAGAAFHMAPKPLVMALANPTPEIMPELRARPGRCHDLHRRSDFPNQVNNVLCFPYIFRGALRLRRDRDQRDHEDGGGSRHRGACPGGAIRRGRPAYAGETPVFGPEFLIPSPFDPRLILRIAPAGHARRARQASRSGRSRTGRLSRQAEPFVFKSGLVMKPVFSEAKKAGAKRVIYCRRRRRARSSRSAVVIEEGIGKPILVRAPAVVDVRLAGMG